MCDVDARQAVERLYAAKDMAPTKQLSIMCRSFADVAEYTLGFPAPQPGSPDAFRLARQALPGPVRRHALQGGGHCAKHTINGEGEWK